MNIGILALFIALLCAVLAAVSYPNAQEGSADRTPTNTTPAAVYERLAPKEIF